MQSIPSCPITGLPAKRRIQLISAGLIGELWRRAFGVTTEKQLGGIEHFGLWESPCGLAFFEPMLEGDEAFYLDLYRRGDFHRALSISRRAEFIRIAELVRPGDKVLDVGCGEGALARHLPHATYVGLDPHCYADATELDLRSETIAAHAASHPEEYDTVCAFHSIEHVADPLDFARDLVKCVRPGGRLCIVVPSRTSPLTEIPNFVLNAPPNHLSWWDEGALRAVADRLDLTTEALETVPFSFDSLVYWMGRFAPKLTGARYFRAHWIWHCALAWSWAVGCACDRLFRVPASARPSGWLLIARRPS
ncbi:MAG TPA: class I SAM-dependent methyltransferase [Stellaceae bacterium]|jgi:SAM-dependent methyltransferase|nr:class I SAM-dependent methyltransferase [Stellaceae bacterium]HEX3419100.1 class I SAM-dependent methyltransferase [Stellaceae bacterium]